MRPDEIQSVTRKKRYLTVKEAADFAGVCTDFVYERVGKPDGIPSHKRGRVWRIPTWEFFQWMQRPETP